MLSKSFKIVSPRTFEIYIEDVNLRYEECVVRVNKAAICKADMRYYMGNREKRILGLKYPMNLLHEAIGTVLKDDTNTFSKGDKVTLVPNIMKKCTKHSCSNKICLDKTLGENYCDKSYFASSNYDGFSKSIVSLPVNNLVKINNVNENIAVFCELISVCISAIRRCKHIQDKDTIAIWGDGILAYIMSSLLKIIYKKKVLVFGKHEEKLKFFYCDNYYFINNVTEIYHDIPIAIECVGGRGSQDAINQILELINIGGKIILTGVTEKSVSINTRRILEKGISLTGSTRSTVEDFKLAVTYLKNNDFKNAINKLVIEEISVENIKDFYYVFKKTEENKVLGKYIIDFKL